MERINLINNLKKFKFPEELEKEHIQEVHYSIFLRIILY